VVTYFSRLLALAGATVRRIDISDYLVARAIEPDAIEPSRCDKRPSLC
jgi:hypothetical protein